MIYIACRIIKFQNAKMLIHLLVLFSGGAVDARSPDGTAASFSKANKNALRIANSSLFFEFVSNEIVNSLAG